MDASEAMLRTPVQTLPFSSSCSLPSSRFPSTSLASCPFDTSSICSSSGLIEIQYPTISQIIDGSTPFSFSSQPISVRATVSSSSTTLEPKFDYLPGVSNSSLKSPTTTGKSLLHASVIVDIPKPLESLQSSSIPPFLSKTYEIVNDTSLDRVISWTPAGQSFVVWDPVEFSRIVLPQHFKHSNFSSFLRQLNTYGFRKIDGDRWEFANEEFLRGKRLLLKNINRRRSPRAQPKGSYLGSSMGMELLGAEDELQKLRGEKHMMMQEVVKMKQEHLVNIEKMDKLNCRLQSAELRQKQMTSFWLKVLRNPNFLMQLRQKKKLREIASRKSIKSSLEPEQPSKTHVNKSATQQIVKHSQSFCELGSTFVLHGLESSSETQLADHLLQDMSDKLGLDVNVQDGSSNKPLEILEPSFKPNASSKGKNKPISKEDAFLGSAGFYLSSPEEFSSNKMVMEPLSKSSTRQVLQIDTSNGKSVGQMQDGMACHTQYLASPVNDVFEGPLFLYSVKPGDEIACKEELCDVGFEAGGNFISGYDVWDNIFCANTVVPGDEIGLSEMWDSGLRSDEAFDLDNCFFSEFPLLPDMDEDGRRDDHPESLET